MKQFYFFFLLFLSFAAKTEDCRQLPLEAINNRSDFISLAKKLQTKENISLNILDLLPLNEYASLPCKASFTATYIKNSKKVTFIVMKKVNEPSDPFTHKDFKILEKTINQVKPTGVLVEAPTLDFMSDSEIEAFKKSCYDGPKFLCGEAIYAALLGHEDGALIQGTEPPSHILDPAILLQISRNDLLFYKATQRLLTFKSQGLPAGQWEKKFDSILNGPDVNENDAISYEQYKSLLLKEINTSPEQLNEQSLISKNYDQANPLQKIVYLVNQAREPFIVKRAERLINRSDNAVIVYSPSHYYVQQNIFLKTFGSPIIKCFDKE